MKLFTYTTVDEQQRADRKWGKARNSKAHPLTTHLFHGGSTFQRLHSPPKQRLLLVTMCSDM